MDEQTPPRVARWDPSKLHFEFSFPDRRKRVEELCLYVASKCLDDPTFSTTKLVKIFFYSDFEAYGRYGRAITGLSYRKLPHGPVPKAFDQWRAEMIKSQTIRIVQRPVFDLSRDRIVPLRDPEYIGLFSVEEISIVDENIRFFWNMSAKDVSDSSHGMAWKLANDGDLIPYEAIFISDDSVTEDDVMRAKEIAKEHGWKV